MPKVNRIHHVAVVVTDLEQSLGFWRDGLGLSLAGTRDVPSEESRVAFLPAGEGEIELVKPTTDASGIARYLAKRGPGLHHLCLEVDDLDALLDKLRSMNVRLINDPARQDSDGRKYAFVHPESTGGVLVELYQRK